jgi:hypothetical protein
MKNSILLFLLMHGITTSFGQGLVLTNTKTNQEKIFALGRKVSLVAESSMRAEGLFQSSSSTEMPVKHRVKGRIQSVSADTIYIKAVSSNKSASKKSLNYHHGLSSHKSATDFTVALAKKDVLMIRNRKNIRGMMRPIGGIMVYIGLLQIASARPAEGDTIKQKETKKTTTNIGLITTGLGLITLSTLTTKKYRIRTKTGVAKWTIK